MTPAEVRGTPVEIAAALDEALRVGGRPGGDGGPEVEASASSRPGEPVVDVAAGSWVPALRAARDALGFGFFDFLTAVDEQEAGLDVVAHLWAPAARAHLVLRSRLPREKPRIASATPVFAGADWCERETFEMFGVVFDGHPRLVPLLLPDGFEGHPLRKDFVLASRVARAWPGVREPGGESRRRPPSAPGVPEPGSWGPGPGGSGGAAGGAEP